MFIRSLFTGVAAASFVASTASAAVVFDADFNEAGLVDGGLTGNLPAEVNGQLGPFSLSDTAGTGQLNFSGGGFLRLLLNFNFATQSDFSVSTATSLEENNERIVIEFLGLTLNSGDINIGLANINDGNPFGNSNLAFGTGNETATSLGVATGESFDYVLTITEVASAFQLQTTVNGNDVSGTVGSAGGGFTTGSTNLAIFLNSFVTSDYSVDRVRVSVEAIPEPASLALLGMGALAMISRRRR